jgi:hypothetical protein
MDHLYGDTNGSGNEQRLQRRMAVLRWTDALLSVVWLRLALWTYALAMLFPGLMAPGTAQNVVEYMDDHQFHAWEMANRITVLDYHQLPVWNPFWCGGTLGIAAPEDSFFAPDTLLRLAFGVSLGRQLSVILALVLAMEGTYRVARVWRSSALGATCAAVTYGTNWWFINFVQHGFFNFVMGFSLMPWALWALVRAVDSRWHRWVGGFFIGWLAVCAGTYPLPYTVMLLTFFTVGMTLSHPSPKVRGTLSPFRAYVVMGSIGGLFAACKLIPLFLFLKQFSRVWTAVEANTAVTLLGNFSKLYIVVIALCALGAALRDRWASLCLLGAGLFFLLAMGDFDPASPYHLLKKLPLFGQLRAPERYLVLTMLLTSLGAARCITLVEELPPRLMAWIFAAKPDAAGPAARLPLPVHLLAVGASTAALAFGFYTAFGPMTKESMVSLASTPYMVEPPRPLAQPFRQTRGNRRDGHLFPYMNLGSLYCIVGIPVPQSPHLRADLQSEESMVDPTRGTVRRVRWTPNQITLQVNAQRSARVLVNQNYHVHWRANVGRVLSHQGMLAVDVPAGQHELVLRFVDRPQQFALALSALTLLTFLSLGAASAVRYLRQVFARS